MTTHDQKLITILGQETKAYVQAEVARVRLEVQATYEKRIKTLEAALGIEHKWPD